MRFFISNHGEFYVTTGSEVIPSHGAAEGEAWQEVTVDVDDRLAEYYAAMVRVEKVRGYTGPDLHEFIRLGYAVGLAAQKQR